MKPDLLNGILERSSHLRLISDVEAMTLVAGKTDKPRGVDPSAHFISPGYQYLLAMIPLDLFADNDAGEAYDLTVNLDRARGYAQRMASSASQVPPIIAGARRSDRLNVIDGGHRISAARMVSAKTICTLVRVPHGLILTCRPDRVADIINANFVRPACPA